MPEFTIDAKISPRHDPSTARTLTRTVHGRSIHTIAHDLVPFLDDFQKAHEPEAGEPGSDVSRNA